MDPEKTGRIISEARKQKSLTQKDLAKKLLVTDKAISKWERGLCFPDISILIPLTEILDISLYDLLKGEKMPKNEVEKVLKNTIEYSNKEINKTKKKFITGLSISLILIVLILGIYHFVFKLETTLDYKDGLVNVEVPQDNGIYIKVNLKNYSNGLAMLVKLDENTYDLYVNVTQTLADKIFKSNDPSNHMMRIGNGMLIDFKSQETRLYMPNNLDCSAIKHIYYVNEDFYELLKEKDEQLINIKDKTLLWENV